MDQDITTNQVADTDEWKKSLDLISCCWIETSYQKSKGPCFGLFSLPVVVGTVLALGRVSCNGADDLLSICVDQLDRVDGQVLIEVSPALGCVRTQVTLVLPLFCNKIHTDTRPRVTLNFTSDNISLSCVLLLSLESKLKCKYLMPNPASPSLEPKYKCDPGKRRRKTICDVWQSQPFQRSKCVF